jgi:hypothetical protein
MNQENKGTQNLSIKDWNLSFISKRKRQKTKQA